MGGQVLPPKKGVKGRFSHVKGGHKCFSHAEGEGVRNASSP